MIVRQLITQFGYSTDKASAARAQQSMERMRNVALGVGAAFVAIGTKALAGFVQEASDAAETANKFSTVFGTAAGQVTKDLEDIEKRTGISMGTLQEYSSSIGTLTKNSLGSAEAAGKMGASFAEVALDIASINNEKPDDTFAALRSGLLGSAEPLQRFGVDIRVAALEAFALSKGITKSNKEMTEGERVALRYELIMRQLGNNNTLGDATRTANELANAQRGVQDQWKALQAELGRGLLPVARDFTVSLRDWLINMQQIVRLTPAITEFPRRIAGAFKTLLEGLDMIPEKARVAALSIVGLLLAFVAPSALAVASLLAISAAILLVVGDLEAMGAGAPSVIGDLIKEFKLLKETTGSVFGAIQAMIETAVEYWDKNLNLGFIDKVKDFLGTTGLPTATTIQQNGVQTAAGIAAGANPDAGMLERAMFGPVAQAANNVTVNVVPPDTATPEAFGRAAGQGTQQAMDSLERRRRDQLLLQTPDLS